ncbi:MAG: histidinol-phosphate transaminase [Bryobacteraceae bacterium]
MPLGPQYIASLKPYEPGLDAETVRRRFGVEGAIKLSSNENPLGVSPLAVERMQQALAGSFRYPSGGRLLRERLAEQFELKLENVIAGSGSEGIMANIVRTFLCDDDEVLTTEGTFPGFRVLVEGRGVAYRTVPYSNWTFHLPALAAAVTEKTKLIYLANPNNPTGTIFTRQQFAAFHAQVPSRVLIILDEAYFEFAKDDPAYPDSMHYRHDNVITLRTFSKAYGLASARIGYGFAHEDLIASLLKVKLPFEPSGISEAGARGALDDREFLHRTLENNARGLRTLTAGLREIGIEAPVSHANFVMALLDSPAHAKQVFEDLLRQGVIVRPLGSFGLPQCLRISVGTPKENERCVESFARVCSLEPALR